MYEDIKSQFRAVISYSQCIPDPKVDILFERWAKAKEKFITRFGGLIYEWPEPVEFTLDPQTKMHRAMEFAEQVDNVFHNSSLASFIDQNIETFFENKISNDAGYQIPKGMKLIKAFKYFEKDKEALRDIQDLASQLIQENKIKGTLCFSVHPLDFLSSSENTYHWRSCHALDGEYRAGNLSYMVDETTFMVYLKGADNVRLDAFGPEVKWNSKKWRMLIHAAVDDEIIFAGRQYPFSSKNGINQVLNIYNNLIQTDKSYNVSFFFSVYTKYHQWHSDYVDTYMPKDAPEYSLPIELDFKYMVYGNRLIALNEVVKAGHGALNYNDILSSTYYQFPYYAILNRYGYHSLDTLRKNPIIIGGEITCLHCGNEVVDDPETMRCEDCEINFGYEENDKYGSCSCCGARIYVDDAPYVGDYDDIVCSSCFENNCFICDDCGQAFYNEDKNFIKFNEDDEGYVCQHCYNRLTSREEY